MLERSFRAEKRKLEEVFNYVPHRHQGLTPRTRVWVTSGGLSAVGTNLHKVFSKPGIMVITSVRPGWTPSTLFQPTFIPSVLTTHIKGRALPP